MFDPEEQAWNERLQEMENSEDRYDLIFGNLFEKWSITIETYDGSGSWTFDVKLPSLIMEDIAPVIFKMSTEVLDLESEEEDEVINEIYKKRPYDTSNVYSMSNNLDELIFNIALSHSDLKMNSTAFDGVGGPLTQSIDTENKKILMAITEDADTMLSRAFDSLVRDNKISKIID